MTTDKYWSKRMKALENAQYQKSRQYYRDVEQHFRKTINAIQMDIEHWYLRLATNNDISYAAAKRLLKKGDLQEFKWSVEEYIKHGKENAVSQKWLKELENASARQHISYLQAMKIQLQQHAELLLTEFEGGITDFLHKSYADMYSRTAYEFEKAHIGSNLAKIDDRRIDAILKKPWAQDGSNFSSRIWTNKNKLINNLHSELAQCITRGESPDRAIGSLARTMNVSRKQAGRLIMTETAAIASAAQKDCYKDLDVEKYEIIAAIDSHTCDICRDFDTKVFDMADYHVGLTAPPFHPNCRCCTMPAFDDEYTETSVASNAEKVYNKEKSNDLKLKVPDEALSVKGITPKVKAEMDEALKELETEWDFRAESMLIEPTGKGDLFVTGWYDGKLSIIINENASFSEKRMEYRFRTGYFAGKNIKDYLRHEIAHVMLYQDCETEQQYRAKFMQIENIFPVLQGISGYADASQSGNEAFAEAFVRYCNGEELPLIVKVLIESYFKRWKK